MSNNINNTINTVEKTTIPWYGYPLTSYFSILVISFTSFSERNRNTISLCQTMEPAQLPQPRWNYFARLSAFSAISTKTLEYAVKHFNRSTCCFDTSPTCFSKNVFTCLEMDVLKIVNGSLLSGIFPKSLKSAAVMPLLKKGRKAPSILYNRGQFLILLLSGKLLKKRFWLILPA